MHIWKEDGFSLIEVAAATVILGVVAAGVASLVDGSVRGVAGSRQQAVVVLLAQSAIERVASGFSPTDGASYFDAGAREVAASAPAAVFVVRWSAAPGGGTLPAWQRVQITATPVVADRRRTGASRAREDVTMVALVRGGS